MDLDRSDVKCIFGLALDAIVIDNRRFTGNDLGHGVREVVAVTDKGLDDGQLRAASCDDQISRVRPDLVAASDEQQMDNSLDDRAVTNNNERALLRMLRLQRSHRVPLS